jgi:ABC-type transport system involved in multi-copper enzyme maturation permease subunit
MRPSDARVLRLLTVDAVRDGVRRRIVPVIAVISLVSLLAIDSCTSCAGGQTVVNGQTIDPAAVAGLSGVMIFVILGLWIVVLAGILASDHLVETLSDGSATLTLSRPVGRASFALARLAGALVIALATGAILLGASAVLLHLRAGAALGAAAWGGAACAAGAVGVAAFAMLSSLYLSRIATVLLVLVVVGSVASVNLLANLGVQPGGLIGAIDRFGPPLAGAIVLALAPWVGAEPEGAAAWNLGLRLVAWAAAGAAALVFAFRRMEI